MPERPGVPVLLALAATVLFLSSARAFFSSIYYQNLATLSLNATVLYALLVLAPVLPLAAGRRLAPGPRLLGAVVVLAGARLLLVPAWGSPATLPLAGIATGAFLVALPAILARATPVEVGAGIALGFAVDAAILLAGDSFDPTLRGDAAAFTLVLAEALLLLAAAASLRAAPTTRAPGGSPWIAGPAFAGFLFLAFAILGNPHHAAAWNGLGPAGVGIGLVGGFAAGSLLAALPLDRGRERALLVGLNAGALLAVAAHVAVPNPVLPGLLALAAAALAFDLPRILTPLAGPPRRAVDGGLLLGGFVLLVLLFGFAFTFTFAYVPLGSLWKGREGWLIGLGLAAVLAGAFAVRTPPARGAPSRVVPVAVAAAVLLAAAGLALPGPGAPAPTGENRLRVLAFNVHQGFNNAGVIDPDVFVRLLREADPDLVALQESDTPRFTSANFDVVAYLASTLGYHAVRGPPSREQSFGVSLLSKHAVVEWRYERLTSGADHRFLLLATVAAHGERVGVAVVHMGLPREDRVAEIGEILALAETLPARRILAGDLNSCPDGLCPEDAADGVPPDDVYDRVTARYADTWVAAGGNATDPAAFTYEAQAPDHRIDYVFVAGGLRVLEARVVSTPAARAASDHLPVLATVEIA